ncbi:DUF167 domain-containing protein [Ciceribacter azotifigens]|uniref:DUF167 domain-containing protein n=1 Tax=Ciceribacter azotifigens TaxID=2069303 RepID=UPI003A855160
MKPPYSINGDHLRLSIRLTPNAGRDQVDGVEMNANDDVYLKAKVTAVPEKGKANKALIALLAKAIGVPKSSISVVSGDTARQKILRIDGDPEEVAEKISELLSR